MNRVFGFGAKKSHDQLLKESNDAMNSAQQGLQSRISHLDTQISQLNMQLTDIQRRLQLTKTPMGQRPLRAQALKLLNKRKKLEQMRESLDNQDWSMTQAQLMTDSLQNTMISVNAMKQNNKILKAQYGKINIDKLEDMQDEMIDLIDKGEELQNALRLNNGLDELDDIDEADLDAELEALSEENTQLYDINSINNNTEEIPSYLADKVPEFIDDEEEPKKVMEDA